MIRVPTWKSSMSRLTKSRARLLRSQQRIEQTIRTIYLDQHVIDFKISFWTFLLAVLLYIVVIVTGQIMIYRYHTESRFTNLVEKMFPYPAAFVNHKIILLDLFRERVAALEYNAKKRQTPTTHADIQKLVIGQLVTKQLYEQALEDRHITITDKNVDVSLQGIYDKNGGKDKLLAFLSDNYGPYMTLDDFRQVIKESLAQTAIQSQVLVMVSVRHILIALPDNPTQAQIDTGLKKAQDIRSKITDPSQFGDIAKQYSEDIASRDKGGDIASATRGNDTPVYGSQGFEDALFKQPVGVVSDPIRSSKGWHIVIVDKKTGEVDKSLKAYTEELRAKYPVHTFIGN